MNMSAALYHTMDSYTPYASPGHLPGLNGNESWLVSCRNPNALIPDIRSIPLGSTVVFVLICPFNPSTPIGDLSRKIVVLRITDRNGKYKDDLPGGKMDHEDRYPSLRPGDAAVAAKFGKFETLLAALRGGSRELGEEAGLNGLNYLRVNSGFVIASPLKRVRTAARDGTPFPVDKFPPHTYFVYIELTEEQVSALPKVGPEGRIVMTSNPRNLRSHQRVALRMLPQVMRVISGTDQAPPANSVQSVFMDHRGELQLRRGVSLPWARNMKLLIKNAAEIAKDALRRRRRQLAGEITVYPCWVFDETRVTQFMLAFGRVKPGWLAAPPPRDASYWLVASAFPGLVQPWRTGRPFKKPRPAKPCNTPWRPKLAQGKKRQVGP